ncbi:MAG TPA: threonine--tRNA ligase [Candidatus Dojkabacteria bacterium]|nr:threonine--tRNA ligase [Candidatus Dojkabacteria bacterium]
MEEQRHTLSHILAMAIKKIRPDTKFGIGPAIENGFYYDIETSPAITEDDIVKIEEEMNRIIKAKFTMNHKIITKAEAKELFKKQPYKLELINEIPEDNVNIYTIGDDGFMDLCRGPHVNNTSEVGVFKLTSIAGAYWKGSEKNNMLQRIYGVAFPTQEELDAYLKLQDELKLRDHRKLGKELKLFMTDPEIGAGLILWLPRGAFLRNQVMNYAFNTYLSEGYEPVITPHIANINLWKTSGHWDFYRESMFSPFGVDDEQYLLKPMNCPFHVKMYNSSLHSYRDLPIRWTEMGTVYRYEKAGELGGLTRVRGFTQDDAHIICTPEQVESELEKTIDLTMRIFKKFGLNEVEMNLSTHDPENMSKYIGDIDNWLRIEKQLETVVKAKGYNVNIDVGEAAFYGPKIDIKAKDVLGRKHQLTTIQVDFNLPERFDMKYTADDGNEKRPIMIHRALLGSLERFIAILIEHYGGIFPLWLSYEQVRIIPINDQLGLVKYVDEVKEQLKNMGVRVKIDDRSESMQKKIRDCEIDKIPYMLIIGEKEKNTNTVSVRSLKEKDKGLMKVEEIANLINQDS